MYRSGEHDGHGWHHGAMLPKGLRIAGWVVFGVGLAILFALLFAFIVQWLWNTLMPAIFGIKAITYWQAVGVIILAKILFGGASHGSQKKFRHGRRRFARHYAHFRRCSDPGAETDRRHADWQYYDQYWQEQGRAAFEAYVQAQKNQSPQPETTTSSAQ